LKILTIVGARPQFVKAAAVSRAFKSVEGITEVIVHTGQHFDKNMSDIFFEEMDIPKPDYHLEINSLSHGAMTGRMLEEIEKVFQIEKPDFTLIYGDTNSTLAGALAARKLHGKVVHVEAGLRSFNMQMPEEINRILTDRISNVLFCPTDLAISNLEKEGFDQYDCQVIKCGDVMEDAALYYAQRAAEKSTVIQKTHLEKNKYILCTVHRAENTDDRNKLADLVRAINKLNDKIPVVLPIHPRTKKRLESFDLKLNATLINPVGYFDMIELIRNSRLVMTDSGGLQKEAFFFNRFCITLREQTEWKELVDYGYNCLTGTDPTLIENAVEEFMNKTFLKKHDFYGGGTASDIIVKTLLKIHEDTNSYAVLPS
jgi:UDP-GlcNAc3NAcA epimerase